MTIKLAYGSTCILLLLALPCYADSDSPEVSNFSETSGSFDTSHKELSLEFGREFLLSSQQAGGAQSRLNYDDLFSNGRTLQLHFRQLFSLFFYELSASYRRFDGRQANYNAGNFLITERPDDWEQYQGKLHFGLKLGRSTTRTNAYDEYDEYAVGAKETRQLVCGWLVHISGHLGANLTDSLSSKMRINGALSRISIRRYNKGLQAIYGGSLGIKIYLGQVFIMVGSSVSLTDAPRIERSQSKGLGRIALLVGNPISENDALMTVSVTGGFGFIF